MKEENKHTYHSDVETYSWLDGKPWYKHKYFSKMIIRKWVMVMRI